MPVTGWMWLKDNSVGRISNENLPKSQSARAYLVPVDEMRPGSTEKVISPLAASARWNSQPWRVSGVAESRYE